MVPVETIPMHGDKTWNERQTAMIDFVKAITEEEFDKESSKWSDFLETAYPSAHDTTLGECQTAAIEVIKDMDLSQKANSEWYNSVESYYIGEVEFVCVKTRDDNDEITDIVEAFLNLPQSVLKAGDIELWYINYMGSYNNWAAYEIFMHTYGDRIPDEVKEMLDKTMERIKVEDAI